MRLAAYIASSSTQSPRVWLQYSLLIPSRQPPRVWLHIRFPISEYHSHKIESVRSKIAFTRLAHHITASKRLAEQTKLVSSSAFCFQRYTHGAQAVVSSLLQARSDHHRVYTGCPSSFVTALRIIAYSAYHAHIACICFSLCIHRAHRAILHHQRLSSSNRPNPNIHHQRSHYCTAQKQATWHHSDCHL